jgi:hypothetical protein
MTRDEIKQLIAEKIAGQGSAIDAASVLPSILNGILEAIPESGVMPEPKYDVPTDIGLDIDDGPFAESLGISIDELPDFFRAQVIKRGNLHLTRTYYEHVTENEEEYHAIFGDKATNYGYKMIFYYNVPTHNIIIEIEEV